MRPTELHCQQMSPGEVEQVHDMLRLCGLDMQERLGLSHWVPPYPLEALLRSAQERQVYAVFLEGHMVATFTIGTQIPPYYREIPALWERWGLSPTRALYVNRLAVLPALQGKGIGRWCMRRIERLALAQGCEVIQLDAYGKHLELLTFYTKLGYVSQGHFFFTLPPYGETEAVCFEKPRQDFAVR
jgi:GNAT superfamily N-acetyltransferase